ncbi:MAG: Panacea domain-containing protein [Candidatus Omnitrophica bacterium]|nr:Panacea domain-containing protein [Candidatus Omnitrophota bacterium]
MFESIFGQRLDQKTKDLATYIYALLTEHNRKCDLFFLTKTLYLCDVASYRYTGKQISNLDWKWWDYGPFSEKIYDYRKELVYREIVGPCNLESKTKHTSINYVHIKNLSDLEAAITKKVVYQVKELDFNELKKLAYNTPPMAAAQRSGQKAGGRVSLDFSTITRKEIESTPQIP